MIGKQDKNANFFDSYVFDNLLPEKDAEVSLKGTLRF